MRLPTIAGMVLVMIAAAYTIQQSIVGARLRGLVETGQIVVAQVTQVDGEVRRGAKAFANARHTVKLSRVESDGTLTPMRNFSGLMPPSMEEAVGDEVRPTPHVSPEMRVRVRVDPNDPNRLTLAHLPPPVLDDVIVLVLVGPAGLIVMALGLFNRWRVLRTWRNEPAYEAVVVDSRQAASSPFSRVVRMALASGRNRTVVTQVVPTRRAMLRPGDAVWLIAPKGRPQSGVLAMLYQE